MSEILECVQHDRVLRIALNRAEKHNALNAELCRELVDAIDGASGDHHVGAIVLTGNGKSLSAGMDLKEIAEGPSDDLNQLHEQLFTLIARLRKPLIGAVNGLAAGGGTGLVANCHIAIASDQAAFGLTEIRLGLWPFLVFRAMQSAVGERRAVELALTGRKFGAQEAKEIGLIHEVTPDFNARAMEVAAGLAAASPTAIRSGLDFIQEVHGKDWSTAGMIARRMRDEVFQGADFHEGLRAFREKRSPTWPSLNE